MYEIIEFAEIDGRASGQQLLVVNSEKVQGCLQELRPEKFSNITALR